MHVNNEGLIDNSLPVLPQAAFVLHGTAPRKTDIITLHAVKDGQLQIGDYVDPAAVVNMIQDANSDQRDHDIRLIPDNVLIDDAHYLVWYVRSARRPFHFRHGSGEKGHWHCQVRYPNLLFIADKCQRRIRIFALPDSSRPTMDSQLYHAPLFNLNSHGDLCLGTATLPESMSVSTMVEMESVFFDANGSHPNHNGTLNKATITKNKTLIGYWKAKAIADEWVRVSELNPYKTLAEVIREL